MSYIMDVPLCDIESELYPLPQETLSKRPRGAAEPGFRGRTESEAE